MNLSKKLAIASTGKERTKKQKTRERNGVPAFGDPMNEREQKRHTHFLVDGFYSAGKEKI